MALIGHRLAAGKLDWTWDNRPPLASSYPFLTVRDASRIMAALKLIWPQLNPDLLFMLEGGGRDQRCLRID